MSKLRAPLCQQLTPQVDERAIQRIWAGVRQRRGGSRFARSRTKFAWAWGIAGALLALALLVTGLRFRDANRTTNADPKAALTGPLVSRVGGALNTLGGSGASNHQLSDGSSIALDAGSRLEVLENTAKTFVTLLRSGRGTFAVQPGGPRRWTIEAGLATVEVVGTRFSVTRSEGAVEVSVEHGVVLVRSELIQDRVQRLSTGQRLVIRAAIPAEAVGSPFVHPLPVVAPGASAARPATLDELLVRADERRRRGDERGAEAALRAALATHANEPQAALAAFTLGKLLLDMAGRPADAAQAFARCLALSPPSALAEDASYRLVEARARAGDLAGASAGASEYRSRYPGGRHARELSRWLGEH